MRSVERFCNRKERRGFMSSKIYNILTFSSRTYIKGVYKKRKFYNRMSKKNSFLFMNVHVLLSEHKISKKKFRLPVCLAVDTITFEGVSRSKRNLVGVFYL